MPFFTIGKRVFFKELYTSPLPRKTEKWIYELKSGELNGPQGVELPYLHFLFFKKTPFYKTDSYWRDDFWRITESDLNTLGKIVFSNTGIEYTAE